MAITCATRYRPTPRRASLHPHPPPPLCRPSLPCIRSAHSLHPDSHTAPWRGVAWRSRSAAEYGSRWPATGSTPPSTTLPSPPLVPEYPSSRPYREQRETQKGREHLPAALFHPLPPPVPFLTLPWVSVEPAPGPRRPRPVRLIPMPFCCSSFLPRAQNTLSQRTRLCMLRQCSRIFPKAKSIPIRKTFCFPPLLALKAVTSSRWAGAPVWCAAPSRHAE